MAVIGGTQITTKQNFAGVQSVTVTLAAQFVNTLFTVPQTIIPAPGSGFMIRPISVTLEGLGGATIPNLPGGGPTTAIIKYGTGLSIFDTSLALPLGTLLGAFSCSDGMLASFSTTTGGQALSLVDNQPINISAAANLAANGGAIQVVPTFGHAGLGYASGDTGVITTGSGTAEYIVTQVDGSGAVTQIFTTFDGFGYTISNGNATATGGAQPGVGTALQVNITNIGFFPPAATQKLRVTIFYRVVPLT